MTASNASPPPVPPGAGQPSLEELFRDVEALRSADQLARDGVFEDGEVEQLVADLHAMRHADLG